MSSGNDDFWGSQSDWSDRANTQPTTRISRIDASVDDSTVPFNAEATRPGQRLKRRWSNLLSSGANPTREHGIVRPGAVRPVDDSAHVSADMFDDLDDLDYTYGETFTQPVVARAEQAVEAPQDWDAEFAPAPAGAASVEQAGVDPLLLRLGVLALVTALLVPVLLSFRGGDTASLLESSPGEPTATSTLDLGLAASDPAAGDPATGVSASVVTDDAPTAEVSAPSASGQLDPNDLPPAIPVNTESSPAESAANDSESDVAESSAEPDAAPTAGSAALDETTADAAVSEAAVADAPARRVAPTCAIDYDVVAGDYWIRLADAAEVPLAELLEANGASESTPIYPGSSICLPAGATTPAPPTTTAAPDTTVATPATDVTTTAAPDTTVAPTTTAAPTTTPTTTPTATPATTEPTSTTPSSTNATPDEVKQIIRDVWPDELEERAIEIAYRESRFVPTAKNYCCYGIFQMYWSVHKSWLDDIGITDDQQLYDPATNARAAYALYERAGGWGPWGF